MKTFSDFIQENVVNARERFQLRAKIKTMNDHEFELYVNSLDPKDVEKVKRIRAEERNSKLTKKHFGNKDPVSQANQLSLFKKDDK